MYEIIYDVTIKVQGQIIRVPDYFMVFNTQDPSGDSVAKKEMYCRMSVARKGGEALSVRIVSERYV